MKAATRDYDAVFWSWRRYLHSQFADTRIYYNPPSQPKPTDVDIWLIFFTGTYNPKLFTRSNPRIICVARNDRTGSILASLATDVVNVLDNETSSKRWITLYDKVTETAIGRIEIIDLSVSQTIFYDMGILSCSIDIFTRIKTARSFNA